MMRDLLHEAYAAMRHNCRRTALTMLGMGWGIATVVMLLAYGDGFGQAVANIRVVYIRFTTMSDLKDTHYLDTIWFNYETPEFERIEPEVRTCVRRRGPDPTQQTTTARGVLGQTAFHPRYQCVTKDFNSSLHPMAPR